MTQHRPLNRFGGAGVLAVMALILIPLRASGGAIWVENNAGTALATAEAVGNIAQYSAIFGSLTDARANNPQFADIYQFTLKSPRLLGAFTVSGAGNLADPQLFLFDSTGKGIVWNNDASGATTQAKLGVGGPYAAGTYYLAISLFAVDPVDTNGDYLFDIFALGGGPAGPGGANPLANWADTSGVRLLDNLSYEIRLAVPEPSTFLPVLLAAGSLIMVRRRKR